MPIYLNGQEFIGGYQNGKRFNGYLNQQKLFNYTTNVTVNYSTGGNTVLSNVPLGTIDRNTLSNSYGLNTPGSYYYFNDNPTYEITNNCTITANVTYNPPAPTPPPTPTYTVTINLIGGPITNNMGDRADSVSNYQTLYSVPAGDYTISGLSAYGLNLGGGINVGSRIDPTVVDNANQTVTVAGNCTIDVFIHPGNV